jgi:hypothetical protein
MSKKTKYWYTKKDEKLFFGEDDVEVKLLDRQIRNGDDMKEFIELNKDITSDLSFARVCTLMNVHNSIMVKVEFGL